MARWQCLTVLIVLAVASTAAAEPFGLNAGGAISSPGGYLLAVGQKHNGQGCGLSAGFVSGGANNCLRLPNGGRLTAASLVFLTKTAPQAGLELGITVETCSVRPIFMTGGMPLPIRFNQPIPLPPTGLTLPPGDCIYFSLDGWSSAAWFVWFEAYLLVWVD